MHWGTILSTGASIASAVISAIVAVRAVLSESRAKASAAMARAEAARAVQAAEQSASAAKRSATALERQVQLAEAAASKYVPPWAIEFSRGSMWRLINNGEAPEFAVTISGTGVRESRNQPVDRIDARSSIEFWGNTGMGGDKVVEVSWHRSEDQTGEVQTWSHPLPPGR